MKKFLMLIVPASLMLIPLMSYRVNTEPVIPGSGKPNVILILMDDMGYGDLGCYGGFPYKTPNFNKLAADGMRFTNFYAAQATCSASRSAFLTGCYPNRIGVSGAFSPTSGIALNPEEQTIARLLKDGGYKPAC